MHSSIRVFGDSCPTFSFNLHCQDAGNLTDGFPSNNDDIWKSRMREVRSNQL